MKHTILHMCFSFKLTHLVVVVVRVHSLFLVDVAQLSDIFDALVAIPEFKAEQLLSVPSHCKMLYLPSDAGDVVLHLVETVVSVADVVCSEEVGGVRSELHERQVPLAEQHVHVVAVHCHKVAQQTRVAERTGCIQENIRSKALIIARSNCVRCANKPSLISLIWKLLRS